jgi:hypothetical protein
LFIPPGYAVADCAKRATLLNAEDVGGRFKFKGTTDVVVAKEKNVINSALRNNVEVVLELETTRTSNMDTHEPQAVLEHLSASFLNKDCGVLTVLTDLNENWVFYWFHPYRKRIMKLVADLKRAQYLLDNMFPDKPKTTGTSKDELPEHFWNRGVWKTVVDSVSLDTIKEDDDVDGTDNKKRKSYTSGAAPRNDSNQGGNSASSGNTHGGSEHTHGGSEYTHGGSGHHGEQDCTLAQLVDYVGHDVGNEMDLLSMTDDEDERIRVVRRFLARHIVPGIVGGGISEVGIDCRTPPSDEIACPTLSESNVLRHNTASS